MEITEKAIYEVLGVKAQESADPAVSGTGTGTASVNMADEGVKVQEPADPGNAVSTANVKQENSTPEPAADADQKRAGEGGEPDIQEPMSPEKRRENAARRRQLELREAVDKAVKAEREKSEARLKEALALAGVLDGEGKPVESMDALREISQQQALEKMNRELRSGKVSQDTLSQLIAASPAVQETRKLLEKQERARKETAFMDQVSKEIAQIHELDPEISSLEDLKGMENYQDFYKAVKRGASYLEAFKSVNYERLVEAAVAKASAAAKQQAINAARGKEHLRGADNEIGIGGVEIPSDELKLIKTMMPGATRAEIEKFYQRYQK